MPRDPYRVLDVEMDASQAEIKLAFRQLTKRTHPDVNPSDNAAETFRRINAAYEIVGDAERRRRFDLGNDWEVRYQILKSCNVEMPIHPRLSLPDLHTQHIPIIAGHGRGMDARGGDESTRAGCRVQSKLTGCREAPKLAKETRRNGRGGFRRRQTTSRINRLYRVRFKRVWGVWCKVWMAGLNVGVPVASAYFVVVGLMHEKLPMFR